MIQRAILLKFDAYLGSVSESLPYEFNILDNMLWKYLFHEMLRAMFWQKL